YGISPLRSKLMAFGIAGFMAAAAGALYVEQQHGVPANSFTPDLSINVFIMVVIGGLGSITGAILGALYLEGLPAVFGSNQTIQFLTSGLGLVAFILYLPGGLADLLRRLGDVVTIGIRSVLHRDATDVPGPQVSAPPVVPPPALLAERSEQ
ncbi:MAG TPA: hypothetical protein VHY81_05150, partial [Acidimicrobiales bacterium]|nr:hypothetical protein [Acidimicrobiales bacterium]